MILGYFLHGYRSSVFLSLRGNMFFTEGCWTAVKALAYVWVSQEGENPENQVSVIREWAARSGVEVVSFYVEASVSGAVPPRERPQYTAMLQAARVLGIRLLVFYDLSGLGEGPED